MNTCRLTRFGSWRCALFNGAGRVRRRALDLARDCTGVSLVVVGLTVSGLIGTAGLATEVGSWYTLKRGMQGGADTAAFSGAKAENTGASVADSTTEARTVAATRGFVDGTNSVSVSVNIPPTSGTHTGVSNAVEVIIQQPQTRLLSTLFISSDPTIVARAVALPGSGPACVLSLDTTASGALAAGGTTNVNLVKCGIADNSNNASALTVTGGASVTADTVQTVGGISTSNGGTLTSVSSAAVSGGAAVADPYAGTPIPSYSSVACTNPAIPAHGSKTFDASSSGGIVVFCNKNINVNAGETMILQNGVFILDRSSLSVAGGATLTVTNATVILTSSTGSGWGTVTINGGATLTATAPTSGTTSGLAFFADANAPSATNKFNGGSTQSIVGAIYMPSQTVLYTGGVATGSGCTQLVADQISFTGNSAVESNCTGKGTKTAFSPTTLVE